MDAVAVSQHVMLSWDDFLWLDQPTPTLPDVVKRPLVAPVLTAAPQGGLISDMVALPLFDQRTSTGDIPTSIGFGSNMCTSSKLVPRKGAGAAWLDDLNDILFQTALWYDVVQDLIKVIE